MTRSAVLPPSVPLAGMMPTLMSSLALNVVPFADFKFTPVKPLALLMSNRAENLTCPNCFAVVRVL